MPDDVIIERADVTAVDELEALFLALHRHHRAVTALPLVDDSTAWRARRASYLGWFAERRALLFVARAGGAPVGYALVLRHAGEDDTFPLARGYAEVYSLSVAEAARGAGVGGRLLDAVDAALAAEGDPPLVIAVMAGNDDALRFYTRRGMVPGELLLYRFPASQRAGPAPA
jgi:ribosomal protein S18 acetylase RimI-like enzyme